MIDAKDLRIGNWVRMSEEEFSIRSDGTLKTRDFQIKGFNDGSGRERCKQIFFWEIPSTFGGVCHSGSYDCDCEPITLTPEILESCGFSLRKVDDWEETAYKNTPICTYWDGVEWCFKYGFDSDLTFAACEYVHQLQNLIYSLTGKEIEMTTICR